MHPIITSAEGLQSNTESVMACSRHPIFESSFCEVMWSNQADLGSDHAYCYRGELFMQTGCLREDKL